MKSGATGERIFRAIMARSGLTATQLARQLGITPVAVRRHIEILLSEGLVKASPQRPRPSAGRGRPATSFQITDAGRDHFHQAYGELAAQAIEQLLAVTGPEGLDALAKAHFAPIKDGFSDALATNPAEPLADALVAALDARGYAAEVSQLAGGAQLCQHHCPVADIARQYPQLCEIETTLIAGLLQSHVQRLATIAHGDGVCTTNIPKGVA